MKNNDKLISTGLRLLSHHVNNVHNEKFIRYVKFIQRVNRCRNCVPDLKDTSSYLDQNIDAGVLVVHEPFHCHSAFQEKDRPLVRELFHKILRSIDLSKENTYFTFMKKCEVKDQAMKNNPVCRDIFMSEVDIIQPRYILGFGKGVSLDLFSEVVEPGPRPSRKIAGIPFFPFPGPQDVFYNPSLKKGLWDLLQYFRDHHLNHVH